MKLNYRVAYMDAEKVWVKLSYSSNKWGSRVVTEAASQPADHKRNCQQKLFRDRTGDPVEYFH